MQNALTIVQAILAILLIAEVLIQQRGSGLGSAFGGTGEIYGVRRGAERFIFAATIVTAVLFLIVSLGRVLLDARS
jgi:protein translocase SecG subunit